MRDNDRNSHQHPGLHHPQGRNRMIVAKTLGSYAPFVAIAIGLSLCCGRAVAEDDIVDFEVVSGTVSVGNTTEQITGNLEFDTTTGLADSAALTVGSPRGLSLRLFCLVFWQPVLWQ